MSDGDNQERLRSELLAAVPMVDQAQACELLALPDADPSATMGRREAEGGILRFERDGRAIYPLLQFDAAEGRVRPAIAKLIAMHPDEWGGDRMLLHWLTRPNASLGGAWPANCLADGDEAVLRAFAAEVEEPLHG